MKNQITEAIIDNPLEKSSKIENSWDLLINSFGKKFKSGFKIEYSEIKEKLDGKSSSEYQTEIRLLNKNDYKNTLPQPLKDKRLAPFPVSNSSSVFLPIEDVYLDIPSLRKKETAEVINLSKLIQEHKITELATLNLESISSETDVLNLLHHYKILNKAFGERSLTMTVQGKKRVSAEVKLGENSLYLEDVQVEIDAGYEGKRLHLIEAKIKKFNEMESINLRQIVPAYAAYSKMYSDLEINFWLVVWDSFEKIVRIIPVIVDFKLGKYSVDSKNEKVFKIE